MPVKNKKFSAVAPGYRIRSIAIAVILLLTAALGVALGVWQSREQAYRDRIEGVYQRAYFDLRDSLRDIELKLNKLSVVGSDELRRQMLEDVRVQAQLSAANIAALSVKGQESENMVRFFNQLGDYCHVIAKRGGKMEQDEHEKTQQLYAVLGAVLDSLKSADEGLNQGESLFRSLQQGVDLLGDSYATFAHSSVEYPEMIYDGPFSDGLSDREAKFLIGRDQVSVEEAVQRVAALFPGQRAEYRGESQGNLKSYLFSVQDALVQITQAGGYLRAYSAPTPQGDVRVQKADAISLAAAFLSAAGFENMGCVWDTIYGNTVYLNFAYIQDGVVCYPDLIKVKVSLVDGSVAGVESENFLYNHVGRTAPAPKDEGETRACLSGALSVRSVRLAWVPTEWNSEQLCYEYIATAQGDTYYVYVDATSLQEVRVMRVIRDEDDAGGSMLQ